VKIEILGTSFVVQSDEEPEYLSRIVEYYKSKVTEVRTSAPSADSLKCAILTGVIIADELFKEKQGAKSVPPDGEELSRITDRLIGRLDESLK
jgi:cell division protein ZapA